jgi:hypothetical protein
MQLWQWKQHYTCVPAKLEYRFAWSKTVLSGYSDNGCGMRNTADYTERNVHAREVDIAEYAVV